MLTPNPDWVYKVASRAAFDAGTATGTFPGMPVDHADGYVHFSTAAQLAETIRLYFAGQADVVLFAVRTADLSPPLVWEPSRRGDLFPHLYGTLPMTAVGDHIVLAIPADGRVTLPEWVR